MGHGIRDSLRDFARRFPDVAQPVSFVDDDEVPGDLLQVGGAGGGEVVGADGDEAVLADGDGTAFEDGGGQREFFGKLLLPLLAQGGGEDQQDFAATFGPALGDDDTGFDGFSETHFIGKQDAGGERGADGEECGVDLVGIEVDAGVGDGAGKGFDGSGRTSQGESGGPVFGVKGCAQEARGLWVTLTKCGDAGNFSEIMRGYGVEVKPASGTNSSVPEAPEGGGPASPPTGSASRAERISSGAGGDSSQG